MNGANTSGRSPTFGSRRDQNAKDRDETGYAVIVTLVIGLRENAVSIDKLAQRIFLDILKQQESRRAIT